MDTFLPALSIYTAWDCSLFGSLPLTNSKRKRITATRFMITEILANGDQAPEWFPELMPIFRTFIGKTVFNMIGQLS